MRKILLLSLFCILAFAGCSKEDKNKIEIKQGEYALHYEDEAQIEATSNLAITYTSGNEYVAKVSDKGLITAGRIGKTSIFLSNGKNQAEVSVVVSPVYNLFPEPIQKVSLGDSTQKIRDAFGTPDYENSTGMLFNHYYLNYDYMFLFENDKITSMTVVIPTLNLPDNLTKFLLERYMPFGMQGYTAAFLNEQQDMAVAITPSSNLMYMYVMYMPFGGNRSNDHMRAKDDIMDAIDALLIM